MSNSFWCADRRSDGCILCPFHREETSQNGLSQTPIRNFLITQKPRWGLYTNKHDKRGKYALQCRLDYYNSLFSVIMESLFRRSQFVQNAAVRLIAGTGRCDQITSHQCSENSTTRRVEFKLAVLVYKSLHALTAPHLTDDCQLVANSDRRRLRSADVDTCIVPRTNARLVGRSCPRFWNTLPAELRQPDIELLLVTFRRLQKNLFV